MIKKALVMVLGLCVMASASAQDESFFTDPSLLEPWDLGTYEVGYSDPEIEQKLERYDSIMIDQPEIWMAADSKYKGAKGDDLKQLADVARLTMISSIEAGSWDVVDEPGPNVAYVRWAISDLYLQKKKRGLLSYTPVGFVVHTTTQAAMRDLWKKIDIAEFGLKIEWLDSQTGEVLSAGSVRQGSRKMGKKKADIVTWQELDLVFKTIGAQTRCHLDNNRLPAGEKRMDCDAITILPEED